MKRSEEDAILQCEFKQSFCSCEIILLISGNYMKILKTLLLPCEVM